MGLKVKTLILCAFTEKSDVWGGGGELNKNQYRGVIAEKGGLGPLADLSGGGLAKKRGVVFLRGEGVDTPMHTMA